MGTGKTRVGKELAQRTNRTFIDTDEEITNLHGSIADIFANGGEEEFRRLEREVVKSLGPRRDLVIATGGGTLLNPDNVATFLGAHIVALTATTSEIVSRITADGIAHRPLLADAEDVEDEVERLLAARAGDYAKFTSVDTTDKSIDEVIDGIASAGVDTSPAAQAAASSKDDYQNKFYAIITVMLIIVFVLVIVILSV